MYIRNAQVFDINAQQVIGDVQYPVGWFYDEDNRAAADVQLVRETAPPPLSAGEKAVPDGFAQAGDEWVTIWRVIDLTPEEQAPAPVVVPQSVTRRQARQALLLAGLLDQVPLAIAAIPDDTMRRMAEIEWQDSLEFHRDRALVISIGAAIGLDAAGLDGLFVTASKL